MDVTHQASASELIDQALAYYRTARWTEALQAFDALAAQGLLERELQEIHEDIRLKQIYEQVSVTAAAGAPRRRRMPQAAVLIAGGSAAVAALVAVLGMVLLSPSAPAAPLRPQAAVVGALPTPAPTATPQPTPAPPVGTLLVEPAAGGALSRAADDMTLIFDASGSMLARLGEQRKIDIAHQAVGELVQVLPDSARVALRTYGRNRPDDCTDVELVQAAGPLDRAALATQVERIVPVNGGRTPIAVSLEQAAQDFNAGASGLIVLLSDGEESCEGDPAAVAAALHSASPGLRISVVGFAVDASQQEQLAAIARAGGGSFFAAADVAQLAGALRQAIAPVYRVFGPDNTELQKADLGDPIELAPGTYRISVGEVAPLLLNDIAIFGGQRTVVQVRDSGGALSAEVVRQP